MKPAKKTFVSEKPEVNTIITWVDHVVRAQANVTRVAVLMARGTAKTWRSEVEMDQVRIQLRDGLAALLRHKGVQSKPSVSVRWKDAGLMSASLEHDVEVIFEAAEPAKKEQPDRPSPVTRMIDWIIGGAPGGSAAGKQADPAQRAEPALHDAHATPDDVRELQDAVLEAARQFAERTKPSPLPTITGIRLDFNEAGKHRRLLPLVKLELQREYGGCLAQWIREVLPEAALMERLTLRDNLMAMGNSPGTVAVDLADVVVLLEAARAVDVLRNQSSRAEASAVAGFVPAAAPAAQTTAPSPPPAEPDDATAVSSRHLAAQAQQAPDDGTAVSVRHQPKPAPALVLKLVGSSTVDFAQPYQLDLPTLPAHFDRNLVKTLKLSPEHQELVQVCSNTAPLTFFMVKTAGKNMLMVKAPDKAGADGTRLPMYYRADTRAPLVGEFAVPLGKTVRLFVNDPDGAVAQRRDAQGKVLPALLLEVVAPPQAQV